MADELNLSPEKQTQKPRKRGTGLRVAVLLVLVGIVAALNYVDLDFLFTTPKNTAEVEIPKIEEPATAHLAEKTEVRDTGGSGFAPEITPPPSLPESRAPGLTATGNATRPANATAQAGQTGPEGAAQNATRGPGNEEQPLAAQNGKPGRGPTSVDVGGGRTAEVGAVIPPIKADSTVTPRFITDLAEFLVNGYYPKGTHPAATGGGISVVSLKSLNLRYGGALVGLNKPVDDPVERRRFVLRYVMMPSMIRALYALYADTFISAMTAEADKVMRTPQNGQPRQISPRERAEMFNIYAAHARTLSSIFKACAADREISKYMQAYWDAEEATLAADLNFQNAQEAGELARRNDSADLAVAKSAADKAGSAYRDAIIKRESARSALISVLRGHPGVRGLGDDQMLYAVAWVQRRLRDIPNALSALDAMSGVLDNMAGRMEALTTAP